MIIRRIKLSSWRALEQFECELQPGLNLLKGPNEAGKSSIVEAIGWALYRDLVGGARLKDEITPIIPAGDPQARPQIELHLEFPDCTAIVRKTLAEESSRRECHLTVQCPGKADESFDQSAAQTRLKKLMECDGLSTDESTSGALEGELLLSAQGASTSFVGRELSSAARAAVNSVALGEGGVLAPTSRLEKVRVALQKHRTAELFANLKTNAIDSARKQTDAARVREKLQELREAHAKYSDIESQIGALRENIETLKSESARLEALTGTAEEKLKTLSERRMLQLKSSGDLAEKRRAYNEVKSKHDELLRHVDEIAHWTQTQTRCEYELQTAQAELKTVEESFIELKEKQEEAWRAQQQSETSIQEARRKSRGWQLAYDVCVAHRERYQISKRIEQLEKAQSEQEKQEKKASAFEKTPTTFQLAKWRRTYDELQRGQQTSAHSSIRLTLQLEHEAALNWQTDGDASPQTGTARSDEPFVIDGSHTISAVIPGVGRIEIATENREMRRLADGREASARALQKELQEFGIDWSELPEAFDRLEALQEKSLEAQQTLRDARQRFQSTLEAGETLEAARELFAHWDLRWKETKEECARAQDSPLEELRQSEIGGREKENRALRECERWRKTENELLEENARLQHSARVSLAQLQAAENKKEQLKNRIETSREALLQAHQRLTELQKDGLDAQARAQKQEELNLSLLEAKRAQDNAIKHQEALGEAVSDELLQHMAHELEQQKSELHRLQTEIAARRAELRGYCDQDPQTELQRLESEIEHQEAEAMRHEARLRGIGILTAALEAERHRLGRELGAPLNRFLSPWVSELRGRETHLEFDENGSRINGVRTGSDGKVLLLPFDSHSGGMQEQTALVLRLILARLAAQKLPGRRLPLILDDPLTQTDTMRRDGLWRVLHEASENLQILFVTCHEAHLPAGEANHITIGSWPENAERNPSAPSNVKPEAKTGATAKKRKAPRKAKEEETSEVLTLW